MAGGGRTSADERLAAELAAGRSVRDAAGAAGVGERTAFRRLAEPAFRDRVVALRADMVAAAAGRLADGLAEAAGVLRALLGSPAEPVRHRAAVKLIELGLRAVELADVERRVADMERRLAARREGASCASGPDWPPSAGH